MHVYMMNMRNETDEMMHERIQNAHPCHTQNLVGLKKL